MSDSAPTDPKADTPAIPPPTLVSPPPIPASEQPYRGRRSALTHAVLESHYLNDIETQQVGLRRGANWFYWVAALSLVNSIISIAGGGVTFLAGLAVSQIADGFARAMGPGGPYFAIGADLVVAVFVCGFGYLAVHGSRAALLAGMVLYALDGVIFILFGAYLPALFHGYVLYQIWHGWVASQNLARLRATGPDKAPDRLPRLY